MTDSLTDDLGFSTDPGRGSAHRSNRLGAFLAAARSWFRAWRRTRPFWGALWLIVAGAWIIYWMSFDIGIALTGGWSYSAGYVMGGSLIMFGLVTWLAPHYKSLSGVVGFLIALGAFPTANLGGFVVGSVLGIIGGSMVWSWGEKKPRPAGRVTSGG
ncbi:putative membrane protein [Nocardioidaceae bacterium Broad-1]|nr:putative membrane protein [Nocardioidaceae bacterium Broad-1]